MSTDTQKPSEHAIRAANEWLNSEASLEFEDAELARVIDQHAIAPAVAEATKKLQQELEQEFYTAHAVGSSFAKELAEARREIDRLKANIGCAREQGSTQFCAEVLGRDKRIAELEEALQAITGTTMSHVASMEHGFYRCVGIAKAVLKPKKGQP